MTGTDGEAWRSRRVPAVPVAVVGASAQGESGGGRRPDPETPYRRAFDNACGLAGEEAVQAFLAGLADVSPAMGHLVIDTVFGDLHGRPGLDAPERELLALAVLATLGGAEDEIAMHLGIAQRIGIPPAKVVEAFVHISAYAGFPRALNAIKVAKRFYAESGLLPLPPIPEASPAHPTERHER
ncbi:carboxymuconolactone decarboxylase family protein [Streptomyces sp. H27-D2]|uniref:carboxymuconolactone decarboxylase family protein n=1 Tax=Streptomyces sp. H27-D2 TaxID=3046304 RepID=UPI002DBFB58E|nr:carboxymuconolactone decarboxylase family protein [Streptomyces sp. H27-D2]MEC4017088.1 carboxymuconolactone decarboxylase family protein [Streptomyces sp. H27-D2]